MFDETICFNTYFSEDDRLCDFLGIKTEWMSGKTPPCEMVTPFSN